MAYLAYGLAWLSTGIAVSVAIWVTKSATPLWAMLIPGCLSISNSKRDN
jgi:hypothetical protein